MIELNQDHTEVRVDIQGVPSLRARAKMVLSNPTLSFLKGEVIPPRHGCLRGFVRQDMASYGVLLGNRIEFVAIEFWVEKRSVWMKGEHKKTLAASTTVRLLGTLYCTVSPLGESLVR